MNQSGASYQNAELKLVAGDVNRVQPEVSYRAKSVLSSAAAPSAGSGFSDGFAVSTAKSCRTRRSASTSTSRTNSRTSWASHCRSTLRVYKADQSGAKQFVGEDRIDHTARDEKIRVKMGDAFDVVGDRKQTEWRSLGSCSAESAWEIELRNHKDVAVEVEDYEPTGADFSVVESSLPYEKKDSGTFSFNVKVPARGKTKLTYRLRLRYC